MTSSESKKRVRYEPDSEQTLSTAILEAIEEQKGEDLSEADFRLYDDINSDALNNLFRKDANANTTVEFNTDDVTVKLWGDGAVKIQVTPCDADD